MEIATQPARTLNPFAGNYLVIAEPRAVQACVEATARSFHDFPYWAARFAARGTEFSRGDSAWLVLASTEGPEHCTEQATWLGTVLAARGMPRLLLERHLERLAEALDEQRPDVPEWAAALRDAGTALRRRREKRLDPGLFARLSADFERAVADEPGAVPGCGALIVAAVADEADVPTAVGSLLEWLADPSRFGPGWLTAVQTTLDAAIAATV